MNRYPQNLTTCSRNLIDETSTNLKAELDEDLSYASGAQCLLKMIDGYKKGALGGVGRMRQAHDGDRPRGFLYVRGLALLKATTLRWSRATATAAPAIAPASMRDAVSEMIRLADAIRRAELSLL